MSLTKGHALSHEIVGKIRGQHVGGQRRLHPVGPRLERAQHASRNLNAVRDGAHVIEHGLDALLQILVVRARDALDRHHQAGHVAECAPAFAAQQLERVGVLLLRHQAAAGAVRVCELHKRKLSAAVHNQVLCPARYVSHEGGAPLQRLDDKVAVRDAGHAVVHEPVEAEFLGHGGAVDTERIAGERATAEGRPVDASACLAQALQVARKGKGVREQPVGPADGLRALQVRVAGHDELELGFCARGDDAQEGDEMGIDGIELGAQPQAHVSGDLVVARAASMQLARRGRPDELAEAPLVGRVDVLVGIGVDGEAVLAPLGLDGAQALLNRRELGSGQDAGMGIGARVSDGAGDVLGVEGAVVRKRGVVLHHQWVHAPCVQHPSQSSVVRRV